MSVAEIEAELDHLEPDELRRIALKSWLTFVQKADRPGGGNECDEPSPQLLADLDEAILQADATPAQGYPAEVLLKKLGNGLPSNSRTVEVLRCWDGRREHDPKL